MADMKADRPGKDKPNTGTVVAGPVELGVKQGPPSVEGQGNTPSVKGLIGAAGHLATQGSLIPNEVGLGQTSTTPIMDAKRGGVHYFPDAN